MKKPDKVLVGLIGNLILSLHHKGELEDVNGNLSKVEIHDYLDQFANISFFQEIVNFIRNNNENVTFVEDEE